MKLIDIIEVFIAGDWGEETYSKETPCAVTCVRGADIIPISEYDFSAIPVRYINQQAYAKKCLQESQVVAQLNPQGVYLWYHKSCLTMPGLLYAPIFVLPFE